MEEIFEHIFLKEEHMKSLKSCRGSLTIDLDQIHLATQSL
jgi:hypothetical protein